MQFNAFLFDLNGTMINDMHYHISAWHQIFNALGANMSYDAMKAECYGKNEELIERIFPNQYDKVEKEKISLEKELNYQKNYAPELKLIEGLDIFLEMAYQKNIKMAIGSAAIQLNVDFVLNGLHINKYFDAIVSADNVKNSKPNPETFLKCADLLGVNPKNCLVFEDAPKGVEAALNAGMPCIAITTTHQKHEFEQYSNILLYVSNHNNLFSIIDAL